MGIGAIRGGGGRGGPKGPRGPSGSGGKGPVGRAGGKNFGAVDKTQGLLGPSGLVGSGEVGAASAAAATAAGSISKIAASLAAQLRSGEIQAKSEAARRLVAGILKEKMNVKSKTLAKSTAEQIEEDPRLSETLERIWQRG